jgi:hypothetical protein
LADSETFLAFSRSLGLRDGTTPARPEAAVKYDFASIVDQQNHWFEKGEVDPQLMESLVRVASRGLYELFRFCFEGRMLDEKGMRIAIRRFVSVAWMLHSEMLIGPDKKPLTLEQLGEIPQIDCTKCALSLLAQRFGDQFGFHARIQKRRGSKENYAAAAKRGWKKRRKKARTKRKP